MLWNMLRPVFEYRQKDNILWADYSGGDIIKGNLVGTVTENGELDFYYMHINEQKQVRIGICHSVPQILDNGKIELSEKWQWLNGDKSVFEFMVNYPYWEDYLDEEEYQDSEGLDEFAKEIFEEHLENAEDIVQSVSLALSLHIRNMTAVHIAVQVHCLTAECRFS